ncbi:MAG: pyridoxamine 5'-phosphate oxidase family protein [Bacteroidaceae bacterium]|nr:pyridoxamine 5'-phosphate oxidase family protein [Bacteroidaceae bacterium]
MRRKDREMSAAWALDVLDRAPYITMSMTAADGTPYALPLSLARTDEQTFYFRCALEGRKLDVLRQQPAVCLSAVTQCLPTVGPANGSFTLQFQSAIAYGTAALVDDEAEKIAALRAICERYLPHHMDAFDASIARSLARTAVVCIKLTAPPVGKCKQYGPQS